MKRTALIMAGGRGERFWPKSRKALPKQFLSLTDDGKTMIQLTVERILPLVDISDIYIATNEEYKQLVLMQLPGLPKENVLCEPIGRNTAPCIGLGAVHISAKYDDAIMMVLPSDHLIRYTEIFAAALNDACNIAEKEKNLVTIGITPDYPETGYGYIKFNALQKQANAYAVECFVEKPDLETARNYLKTESYLWNSGMFVWKVSSILDNFKEHMSDTHEKLMEIKSSIGTTKEDSVLKEIFPAFTSESIDYGIMEKADNIYILPGAFGWDDVGSWLAVERIKKPDQDGNIIKGNIISINSEACILEGSEKLIAAVGLKDIIVVDTKDATLICDKEHTADIKKVLSRLREENKDNYL